MPPEGKPTAAQVKVRDFHPRRAFLAHAVRPLDAPSVGGKDDSLVGMGLAMAHATRLGEGVRAQPVAVGRASRHRVPAAVRWRC